MIWTMQRKDKQIEPVQDAGCYGEMLAEGLDIYIGGIDVDICLRQQYSDSCRAGLEAAIQFILVELK